MIKSILKHLKTVDPIHEHRWFIVKFCLVLIFSILMYIYDAPPERLYFLFIPIATELAGFLFYSLKEKIIAKLILYFCLCISILVFSTTKDLGIILAVITFLLVFLLSLFAILGPMYRAVVCIALAFGVSTLFHPGGWFSAVNASINIGFIVVFSILIEILFIPITRHYMNNNLIALLLLFQERINLILKAIKTKKPIPVKEITTIYQRDMDVRHKFLALIDINKKYNNTFTNKYCDDQVRIGLLSLRQSIIAIMNATNDLFKHQHQLSEDFIACIEVIKKEFNIITVSLRTEKCIKPEALKGWLTFINKKFATDDLYIKEFAFLMRSLLIDTQNLIIAFNHVNKHYGNNINN